MICVRPVLARLVRDRIGGALVEFALLAPVFIGMVIGVIQIGMYMQSYTAVRSLASDAARFAAVEYQKNNNIGTSTLASDIAAIGVTSPYNLGSDRLTVTVNEVASRVNGAHEFDMDISYSVPTFMSGIGFHDITIDYSRPLFVIDNS